MRLFNKKKKNSENGFLLLELVVALGVFISVIAIGMGAVLAMFGANKKTQALKTVMNNLNFAVDTMGREIAVAGRKEKDEITGAPNVWGSSLWCDNISPTAADDLDKPQDCLGPNGGTYVTFCDFEGDRITYRFNDAEHSIERVFTPQGASECPDFPVSPAWERITAPEVTIEDMKFYVTGTGQDDNIRQNHPKVLVKMEGEAGVTESAKSQFEIQTTLSQRIPDLSILF